MRQGRSTPSRSDVGFGHPLFEFMPIPQTRRLHDLLLVSDHNECVLYHFQVDSEIFVTLAVDPSEELA